MSDLDDLARAASDPTPSGVPPYTPGQQFVQADGGVTYAPPDAGRLTTWVWIGAGVTIVLVLVVTFVVIQHNVAPPVQQSQPQAPPAAAPVPAPAAVATEARPQVAPAKPRTSSVPGRELLEDISDPTKALQIYHCQRGAGDTLEIKARNRSKRGLFVKSVQFFAESDQNNPLADIGFWLPVGGGVQTGYPVPELSRRLRVDEKVVAVIVEAEFRDTAPPTSGATSTDAPPAPTPSSP